MTLEPTSAVVARTITWHVGLAIKGAHPARPKPEPLPFFLDPRQIEALTPEIDWSARVNARIENFKGFAGR